MEHKPSLDEWVAAGNQLMDYPIPPSGKPLKNCTRDDLVRAAEILKGDAKFNAFMDRLISGGKK